MIKVIHLDKALRGEAAYLQSIERARADAQALREFAGDSAKEAILTPAINFNQCGCNHWGKPRCPEPNCTWRATKEGDTHADT